MVLKPRAVREIAKAFEWYELQRKGAGLEFLDAIESTLESLRENPERATVVIRSVRRSLLPRFPFGLFYAVRKDSVVVLALVHARRDPRRWPRYG